MTHIATISALLDHYRSVRAHTEALAAPLTDDDQCVQSMPDASPATGETIHTENSHKYSLADFDAVVAASAAWRPRQRWTDPDELFSIHLLERRRG